MNDLIQVHGCPHPLKQTRIDTVASVGTSLYDIVHEGLDNFNVPHALRSCGHAFIGDTYIDEKFWKTTYPKANEIVTYKIVPQGGGGGGGKNPLRTVLTIAVIITAIIVSNGVASMAMFANGGTFLGLGGTTWGGIAAAAVTTAGMLAVNAICPINTPSLPASTRGTNPSESEVYSIEGATNAIDLFGVIPVVLGCHRVVPPQAALPASKIVNNQQYVSQLFVLGYSPMVLAGDYYIGETKASYYDEIEIERDSYCDSSSTFKNYKNDVKELALSVLLTQASGWQIRTTPQECDQLSVDISFPQGLCRYDDNGKRVKRRVNISMQYAPKGTGAWKTLEAGNSYIEGRSDNFDVPATSSWVTYYITPQGYITYKKSADNASSYITVSGNNIPIAYIRLYGDDDIGSSVVYANDSRINSGFGVYVSPPDKERHGSTFYYRYTIRINPGYCKLVSASFYAATAKALRRTYTINLPEKGLYDVRVCRTTADTTSTQILDKCYWGTLRAVSKVSPIKFPKPLDIVNIYVKATDQLNNTISDFNTVCQSYCLDWNKTTSEWELAATSNPASLFRHVLQHPANAKPVPDDQIDLEQLAYWHEFCEEHNFEFNHVLDTQDSVFNILRAITSAGRASVSRPDGQWSVVIDEPRNNVIQHFTPRNSWGFSSTKILPEIPHAFRVTFINERKNYQTDEYIVFNDGYNNNNATLYEGLELKGVTNPDQVYSLARYHMAVAKLRPERYEFSADMEHIVCTRGDLIRVSHDVTYWGISSGRVKSVDGQTITVDELCPMQEDITYTLRWRDNTGVSHTRDVVTDSEATTTIILSGEGDVPSADDLFMFGETAQETAELIVTSITPGADMTAIINAVDYSPDIFDVDTQEIPDFNSNITQTNIQKYTLPEPPQITSIVSDETVLVSLDGRTVPIMRINFFTPDCDSVKVRHRCPDKEDEWIYITGDAANGFLDVNNVLEGDTHELQISGCKVGMLSDWSPLMQHTIVGRRSEPPTPTEMTIEGNTVTWKMPSFVPIDVVGWEVYATMNVSDSFDVAMLLTETYTRDQFFDITPWSKIAKRIWVRTVDELGNYSSIVTIDININGVPVDNVVKTISHADDGWPGTLKNGFITTENALQANSSDQMWASTQIWDTEAFWGTGYKEMTYDFVQIVTDKYNRANISVDVDIEQGHIAQILYVYGQKRQMWSEEQMWIEDVMWGSEQEALWKPLPDYINGRTGDEIYIKVKTTSDEFTLINDVAVTLDVPDYEISYDRFEVSNTGTIIPVPPNKMRWIKTITFGLEHIEGNNAVNVQVIDRGDITDGILTTGPTVRCLDLSGNAVAGIIDARIQGAAFEE